MYGCHQKLVKAKTTLSISQSYFWKPLNELIVIFSPDTEPRGVFQVNLGTRFVDLKEMSLGKIERFSNGFLRFLKNNTWSTTEYTLTPFLK